MPASGRDHLVAHGSAEHRPGTCHRLLGPDFRVYSPATGDAGNHAPPRITESSRRRHSNEVVGALRAFNRSDRRSGNVRIRGSGWAAAPRGSGAPMPRQEDEDVVDLRA